MILEKTIYKMYDNANAANDFESAPSNIINGDLSHMSFVGMGVFKNGIIAFGDSKSTHYDKDLMSFRVDSVKPMVEKLFHNNKFVMVSWGVNNFLNKSGEWIYLDDWLNAHINESTDHIALLNSFSDVLSQNSDNSQNTYNFAVGIYGDEYKVLSYDVTSEKISRYRNTITVDTSNPFFLAGLPYLTSRFNPDKFPKEITKYVEPLLKEEVSDLIESINNIDTYNSAGLPVKTFLFQPVKLYKNNIFLQSSKV